MLKINHLVSRLQTSYKCNLFTKHGGHRVYFDHPSKVKTYVELTIHNDEVINSRAVCYYVSDHSMHYNWIKKYKRAAEEFIHDVNMEIHKLIRQ